MMVKGEKRTTLILCPCVSSKANELKTVLINMEVEGLRNNFPKTICVPVPLGSLHELPELATHPPGQTASLVG